MRHQGTSEGGRNGIVRRFLGVILFLLVAPILLVVGLLLIPVIALARLFGVEPPRRFARHGCAGRSRAGGRDEPAGRDTGSTPNE